MYFVRGHSTAQGLDAKSLSSLILDNLKSHGLDIKSCLVGQGYDGASVTSGSNKGVQQIVRQPAPLAIYTHCYAHRQNLVLVDSCKSVTYANDFLMLLEKLYVECVWLVCAQIFYAQMDRCPK